VNDVHRSVMSHFPTWSGHANCCTGTLQLALPISSSLMHHALHSKTFWAKNYGESGGGGGVKWGHAPWASARFLQSLKTRF